MPPREPRALLEDALEQAEDLIAKSRSHTLDRLLADRDLQAVFERRFEVLGEALRRLQRADASIAARIDGAAQAIEMRNFIAHGYDGVDHRILWSTTVIDLPPLPESILRVLSETGAS